MDVASRFFFYQEERSGVSSNNKKYFIWMCVDIGEWTCHAVSPFLCSKF